MYCSIACKVQFIVKIDNGKAVTRQEIMLLLHSHVHGRMGQVLTAVGASLQLSL